MTWKYIPMNCSEEPQKRQQSFTIRWRIWRSMVTGAGGEDNPTEITDKPCNQVHVSQNRYCETLFLINKEE